MSKAAAIAYVPVLHEGYRKFIKKHADGGDFYLLGPDILAEFPHLSKDVRALDPLVMRGAIESLGIAASVAVLDKAGLARLAASGAALMMPDEDIMRELAEKYFSADRASFDSVFLRWDKKNTVAENVVAPDRKVSRAEFDREMMRLAETEAERSPDWWRRIGAVLVKDGRIVLKAHNTHVPSEQITAFEGDPRGNFHKGVHLELSLALHAEAGIVAEAARQGISLEGASLYSTTFPCPPCAKQIAYSGIRKIYYSQGYAVLDGERIFKDKGVEVVHVDFEK